MSTHRTVVVDQIFEMLEAAKSSIVPGSVCQAIVSAVQNVPSNIKQNRVAGSSGSAYMTFPLSPIVKNCCLDKTYLNLEFDINFSITAKTSTAVGSGKSLIVPFYIGFRDSFSLFNQVQFLIENSCIWQTVYQREESVNSYNSLPETEIRGNPQYSSIEKMREGKKSPMKRILIEFVGDGSAVTLTKLVTVHYKITVDINRLSPIFSNLSFTTPHMGNLRLKVFMQEIEKALFFCPDYGFNGFNIGGASSTPTKAEFDAAIDQLTGQPTYRQYWSFYAFNNYFKNTIAADMIPVFGLDDGTPILLDSITFGNPTSPSVDFMTFANSGTAEIVQTCFDIYDEEYKRLTDHFASLGSVIIPTQTWSTNVFNNVLMSAYDPSSQTDTWQSTMIGNVGGYSIDLIGVWAHSGSAPCSFSKEFLNNFQLLLEGRPINAVPYQYEDDRFTTDTTQAIIDTDHEEINRDYVDSIAFLNETDTPGYMLESANDVYGGAQLHRCFLSNPNTFAMYFSTNLPNCFRSGACNLENTNRQAILRLTSSASQGDSNSLVSDRDDFPHWFNHVNNPEGTVMGFSCLCDAVVVLNYDAERGTCFDGTLSWAAPYQ